MRMNIGQESECALWEASFRAAAQADAFSVLTEHLRLFGLQGDPELLLEGTIQFVAAIVRLATLDGRSVATFLDSQKYDPRTADAATYAVTFDIFGRAFA